MGLVQDFKNFTNEEVVLITLSKVEVFENGTVPSVNVKGDRDFKGRALFMIPPCYSLLIAFASKSRQLAAR